MKLRHDAYVALALGLLLVCAFISIVMKLRITPYWN